MPIQNRNYFPDAASAARITRETLVIRAAEAYKVFYPAVSALAIYRSNIEKQGAVANQKYLVVGATPKQTMLTANSDTPYAGVLLDLSDGPIVMEMPPGPIMGMFNSLYYGEVGNAGLVGPDEGKGGTFVIVPPGYQGDLPKEMYKMYSETNRVLGVVRYVNKKGGTIEDALDIMRKLRTYPLGQKNSFPTTEFLDYTGKGFDATSAFIEDTMDYWEYVHGVLQDAVVPRLYMEYGRLAHLGIQKGKPFNPTQEQKDILMDGSEIAIEQMTVEAFASPAEENMIWPDRRWEWAGVIGGSAYLTENYHDHFACDRWFFQAAFAGRLMFPRRAGAGSEYLLGLRDNKGNFLDGGKTYRLTVPTPVPSRLFWSLTVYDPRTRSEIKTDTNRAAVRSLYEKLPKKPDGSIELFFGPNVPAGQEDVWVKTMPDRNWFCYFRTYGPEEPLYNGSWKLFDFEEI